MSAPLPILLFPCNGNALEALDCLDRQWACVGFIDDSADRRGDSVQGIAVHGREALQRWPDARVLAVPGGPGSFTSRRDAIASLDIPETRYAQVIHPRACMSAAADIGYNVLLMAGVVVTSNAVIGNHCCILPNSVVHHDSTVGHWTLVGANVTIAGGVTIGENCYVGAGSGIMNGVCLGDRALVGFGANVIHDIQPGTTVAGNPARVLRRRQR